MANIHRQSHIALAAHRHPDLRGARALRQSARHLGVAEDGDHAVGDVAVRVYELNDCGSNRGKQITSTHTHTHTHTHTCTPSALTLLNA